jgi:pimeloyl-ACP methyl ester carboxylesterase
VFYRFRIGLLVSVVLLPIFRAQCAHAQEVLPLVWPTRNAAPPPSGAAENAVYLPMLRAAVARLPEAGVVNLALTQSSALGLSTTDSDKISRLVSQRYAAIASDPVFKNTPSALGYCVSETRPTQGLAFLYRPKAPTDAHTPVLLFLHGYGGSFLWYVHQFAEWFPDHIIVCPAYGTDPSAVPAAYLDECLAAAAVRLKHPLAKPSLVGISAGGFGATRVYAANPATYRQLIVLAAYPPDDAFRSWPKSARAGFLAGELEYYVKDGGFASYAKSLAARSARFQGVVIPKTDHFFLLTHQAETRRQLQAWLK